MKRIALLCVLLTALFAVCALAPSAASAETADVYQHDYPHNAVTDDPADPGPRKWVVKAEGTVGCNYLTKTVRCDNHVRFIGMSVGTQFGKAAYCIQLGTDFGKVGSDTLVLTADGPFNGTVLLKAIRSVSRSAVTLYHHSTKQDLVNGGGSIGDSDKLEAFCKIKMVSGTGTQESPAALRRARPREPRRHGGAEEKNRLITPERQKHVS